MPQQLTPQEWCDLLFGEAEGWINIFAVSENGDKQSRWARDAEQFGKIIADGDFRDTWVGCATRHENLGGQRGTDNDCYEVPGLWLDIDIKGPHHKAENLPQTRDDAVSLLKDFPLRPTVVLDSGGGLQAWWLFDELQAAPEVEPLLKRWGATWKELGRRRGWHVDNVFDLARILRVPGTYNYKSEPPKPVTVIHASLDRRFTPDDLDEYTLDLPPEPERPKTPTYDGPERAGDRYNNTADAGKLLEAHGCVFDHADRDGARHYRAPHHANERGTTGIVVHADGYTVVFSETFAMQQTGLEVGTPYDPFGLFMRLEHHNDPGAAANALEPRVDTEVRDLIAPPSTSSATLPTGTTLQVVSVEDMRIDARFVKGGDFIFGETPEIDIRWGLGADVLWAMGESLMIVGPPGVGKTTIAHQLVAALIGVDSEVLGYPVTPAKRVLYLAMDRPQQIRRAIRRLFVETPAMIDLVNETLIVQNGPIPSDLGKRPELLLDLAEAADAQVVVIDSLKDAAIKLSDDETGGNVNRSIQICNAEGVDVAVLHHQRKGQNGEKPTKLEDVYGSIWLTAGTGSVLLVWGEAGAQNVELTQLKQPMDTVGPLQVEHDHIRGRSTVVAQFDTLGFLRLQKAEGATIGRVAQAEHSKECGASSKEYKAAQRKLERLVADGHARRDDQNAIGSPIRYYAVDRKVESLGSLVA